LHEPRYVQHGAKASLGVGDHRHVDGATHAFELHDHLGQRTQAKVWIAERAGRDSTGVIDERKAGLFDQPGGDHIIGARSHEETVLCQECA
jgi:hypothetical protein